ncbi:MAG TPA: hypothetical protein VGP41_15935 [Candidatus Lustribacter sp.]|nr:hypothetical protein [Candidatus Lustribacter sp.]
MTAEEAIVDVFERRAAAALFVTEVQYGLVPPRDPSEFAAALEQLVQRGEIIIVTKPAPDVHLADADLRIAARVAPGAGNAIETAWQSWLADFLSTHRCS